METNKKLKAKDLINVGIYTAIYIVFFFVAGIAEFFSFAN